MYNTCIKHGRDIRTQYIGSTSILLWRKDWSSIRFDRMQSSFKKHFQLIVPESCSDGNWRSHIRKSIHVTSVSHQRSLWNTIGTDNWVQNMLNDQKDKLCNHLEVFHSSQPIPNPSRDRSEQPVVRTDRSGQPVVGSDTRTVQDGRKTSRSQEIDVKYFHEVFVSSERSGQPVAETSKTHSRSSDDSKSLNVEFAHDRSWQPVVETHRKCAR